MMRNENFQIIPLYKAADGQGDAMDVVGVMNERDGSVDLFGQ